MFIRQPQYFKNFRCIGGKCANTCCYGWRIDWEEEEIAKLKNADNVSFELRALIENAFVPLEDNKNKFNIKLNEENYCPLLTDEGLCRIQKEIGAEYLSAVCKNYPRLGIITKSSVYRFCRFTCGEVMSMLLNNDKAMDLVNVELREKELHIQALNTTSENSKRPELKYFEEIFEFFYEIISNKKRDVEDSLVLGTLAAQSLTKLSKGNHFDQISQVIKKLKAQMHDGNQIKSVENIKPNYNVKLGLLGQLLKLICEKYDYMDTMNALTDSDGRFNIDRYIAGEAMLREHLKEKPFAMRNIALNLLFELNVPLRNDDLSIFENYAVYVTIFALLKLNAIAVAELQRQEKTEFKIEDTIIRSAASICRTLCQNTKTDTLIMNVLNGNGMVSPGYLALLVK